MATKLYGLRHLISKTKSNALPIYSLAAVLRKPTTQLTSLVRSQYHLCEKHSHRRCLSTTKVNMGDKPVETAVRTKITEALKPTHLEVINESYMHNVPKGSESHFKVVVVSDAFENVNRIKKHQLVHAAIQEELDNCIHALTIVAKTPKEWEANPTVTKSPPCQGGSAS